MNLKVRVKNPVFWVQIVLSILTPVLAYAGLTAQDLTTYSKYIYQTDRESLYRALLFKCLDRRYYYDRERNQIKGC